MGATTLFFPSLAFSAAAAATAAASDQSVILFTLFVLYPPVGDDTGNHKFPPRTNWRCEPFFYLSIYLLMVVRWDREM